MVKCLSKSIKLSTHTRAGVPAQPKDALSTQQRGSIADSQKTSDGRSRGVVGQRSGSRERPQRYAMF